MPFTVAGTNFTFTSLEMALSNVRDDPLTVQLTVQLMTDAAGLPGAIIEAMSLVVPIGPPASLVSRVSVPMPTLTAGTTYWIATNAGGLFAGGWDLTSPMVTGTPAFSHLGLIFFE